MLLDAINHRVAIHSTEATAEEFHHPRIAIHDGKRGPIPVAPSTQVDTAAEQCRRGTHDCAIPAHDDVKARRDLGYSRMEQGLI
jgi:hypothetical protein